MVTIDIKDSIIESAIQGKLIDNKLNLPPVVENNTYNGNPYEIPSNWRWCKVGDFLSIETGLSYKKTEQTVIKDGNLRILRGGNINNNFQYLLRDDDIYVNYTDKYKKLEIGDIITPSVTSMEQIGKTAYIDKELDNVTAGGFVYIIRSTNQEILDPKYVLYFISSNFHKENCKPNIHKSGQAFYNLKKSGLVEQPIPIPPIAEQKAIVNKIENTFKKIDEISNVESELISLELSITMNIKDSIIESAIQGKLINNKLNLPPVVENNTYNGNPYEIPSNWRWCKVGDFLSIETGLSYKKTEQTVIKDGNLRILRGGNINNNFQYLLRDDDIYVNYTDKYKKLEIGDIITPSVTSMEQIGKTAYIDKELDNVTAGGFVYIIRSTNQEILDPKYVLYFISSNFHKENCKPNIHKSGQAFYNLKKSGLVEQPIPIPPIAEQKAIVNKIENTFKICDTLEISI